MEDKLQEGVPGCIGDFGRAGIATWVLTGDKEETAINIAHACQLLDTTMAITVINARSHPTMEHLRQELMLGYERLAIARANVAEGSAEAAQKQALVIDGDALEFVLKQADGGAPIGCQQAFPPLTPH